PVQLRLARERRVLRQRFRSTGERDGYDTKGSYFVLLPDRSQTERQLLRERRFWIRGLTSLTKEKPHTNNQTTTIPTCPSPGMDAIKICKLNIPSNFCS
ncbi:UNVERIFIED_CONTAM: hypothetical protein GTU68_063132, partial [Idotea baltica]|nr:hypothetical protein [Idotea baltica]